MPRKGGAWQEGVDAGGAAPRSPPPAALGGGDGKSRGTTGTTTIQGFRAPRPEPRAATAVP